MVEVLFTGSIGASVEEVEEEEALIRFGGARSTDEHAR
jgi:hypothetical protein